MCIRIIYGELICGKTGMLLTRYGWNKTDWLLLWRVSALLPSTPPFTTATFGAFFKPAVWTNQCWNREFCNPLRVHIWCVSQWPPFMTSQSLKMSTLQSTVRHHAQWTHHVLSVPECLEGSANVQEGEGGWKSLGFPIISSHDWP